MIRLTVTRVDKRRHVVDGAGRWQVHPDESVTVYWKDGPAVTYARDEIEVHDQYNERRDHKRGSHIRRSYRYPWGKTRT